MNITEIWIKAVIGGYIDKANLIEIAEMFQEGFPGLSVDDIADKIRTFKVNKKFFIDKDTGEKKGTSLRNGWHKIVIPDGTVDLFEARIQINFAHYGYSFNWIDAWYYHVRSGQIH